MSLTFSYSVNNRHHLAFDYRYHSNNMQEQHQIQIILDRSIYHTGVIDGVNVSSINIHDGLVGLLNRFPQFTQGTVSQLAIDASQKIMDVIEMQRNPAPGN